MHFQKYIILGVEVTIWPWPWSKTGQPCTEFDKSFHCALVTQAGMSLKLKHHFINRRLGQSDKRLGQWDKTLVMGLALTSFAVLFVLSMS